ncbi:MAG: PsbP-related protein [bacterium]|nr:PsbP-related protein [bacterium]
MKNLRGGISIINIVIILGLIALGYLGYTEYLDDKVRQDLAKAANLHKTPDVRSSNQTASVSNNQTASKKTDPTAAPNEEVKRVTPPVEKQTIPNAKPGYYKNYTYFYEINFPPDWPIRIRAENNISLGAVPPKNGQGAITIEVISGETNNEIQQAKAEAKKYPGLVSLTEEPIVLAGVAGTKLTLNNFMAKIKNIYILLIKNNLNYILKYSEESAEFTKEAEQALSAFKFTPVK